ncbi:hypothetical protein PUG46_15890 [Erwiniaceae bacterium L1_55_4]|nr:hypothetical protein [Erwiniaceae bacterium L1_55_4]
MAGWLKNYYADRFRYTNQPANSRFVIPGVCIRLFSQLLNGKKQGRRALSRLLNAGSGQAHQLQCQLSPVNLFSVSGHQQAAHSGQPTGFIENIVIKIFIYFLPCYRVLKSGKYNVAGLYPLTG